MSFTTIAEEEIKSGAIELDYDSFERAPQDYRDLVVQLLLVQADGEIGVRDLGYFELIGKFPNPADQWMAARVATEEIGHFRYANNVLNGVGFDASERVFVPRERRYLPLFRHEMNDFAEVIAFKGIVETMGRLLLESMFDCNFLPWRDTVRRIWQEEKGHIGFGITRLRRMCESEEGRAQAQAAIDIWYPRLGAFSKESAFTRACMEWGLKQYTNAELIDRFEAETTPWLEEVGLRRPSFETAGRA
jgi:1,2-phenylacetyl-CoA epoxidase catalytic subunit